MASDQNLLSDRPSAARALLHDHLVQLAAWVVAVEVAIYGVPLLAPAALAGLGVSGVQIPFVAIAAAAAFYALTRIDDPNERRFWLTLGAGSLCWLVTVTLVTASQGVGGSPIRDAMVAAGYVCFYVPFLLAAERLPHRPQGSESRLTARWLNWSGLVLWSIGWFVYFIVVPIAIDSTWPAGRLRAAPLFVVLDVIIAARFASLAVECRSPRWTWIYGGIAAAFGALLVTNLIDVLIVKGLVTLPNGSGIGVMWSVPPLCLLVAFRLRQVQWGPIRPAAAEHAAARDREPAAVAFRLIALAACFPLVHAALHETGALTATAEATQNVVALAAMALLGGTSIVAYRSLERERAAAERARAAFEERLREARKMEALGRLSSVVTHEFLNLLNAIGGYIDLTLDDLGTDDVHADNLRRAHDVVRRTTLFTTRLLILSRGQPFHPASIVLDRKVTELLPEIRAIVKPRAAVDAPLGCGDGRVAMSADYLREVLMPLATNAGEAIEGSGRLTIETGWVDLDPLEAIAKAVRPGRYGRVVVRDTGVGMPRDVLAHLYEPFFTTKPKPRNRGLGLATAYVVVTQHGGAMAVTSELGVGTCVEVLIPAAPTADPAHVR
ncbi:MAG: ATP-binding protein [Acidobacteria bacterium]|nr:ATP-binding protein [Acidobacteriota bacterium]